MSDSIIEHGFCDEMDGLLMVTRMAYHVTPQGNRIEIDHSNENQLTCHIRTEIGLSPPAMLHPSVWIRFQYSWEDIQKTLKDSDTLHVWQLLLVLLRFQFPIDGLNDVIRPSHQSLLYFMFHSRKHIIQQLQQWFNRYVMVLSGSLSTTNRLASDRKEHKPWLPRREIDLSLWHQAKKMIPTQRPSLAWQVKYSQSIPFAGCEYIPVAQVTTEKIYMVRIVKKEIYDTWRTQVKLWPCIVTQPVYIYIGQQIYVMTHEACFFQTQSFV